MGQDALVRLVFFTDGVPAPDGLIFHSNGRLYVDTYRGDKHTRPTRDGQEQTQDRLRRLRAGNIMEHPEGSSRAALAHYMRRKLRCDRRRAMVES